MPQTSVEDLVKWLDHMRDSGVWEHLRYDTYFDECIYVLERLQRQLDSAKKALRIYGRHSQNCRSATVLMTDPPKLQSCDCGFTQLIKDYERAERKGNV